MSALRLYLLLAFALGLVLLLALSRGEADFGPLSALAALVGFGEAGAELIVREIRLPRALCAILVGFSLAASGAALQGLLRNPLADPGVLGVSAAAGLGAVSALYVGFAGAFTFAVPLAAVAGAFAATLVLYLFAWRSRGVLTLILIGVAVSAIAGALSALVINLAPTPVAMSEIVLWLMGSLANRSFADLGFAVPLALPGVALLMLAAPALRALTLGEEVAETLGVNLARTKVLVVTGTALAVGASVAISGSIGFIGLIVPHMLRPLVGHDPARLVGPSGLAGAMLLLVADTALRLAPLQMELQLGVVTALIGAPFFLYLIVQMERGRA